MNILYITPKLQPPIVGQGIYADLLCELRERGHLVDILAADSTKEILENINGFSVVRVNVGKQYNVSFFKKGIVLLLIKSRTIRALKKFYGKNKYDLVLYEAPPVTFAGIIKYCKKLFNCKSYLMMKDIFPQNAIDISVLKKTGFKGLIYKHFKRTEKKLYLVSDKIGSMSQKNLEYLQQHNPYIANKLEVFPNCVYPSNNQLPNLPFGDYKFDKEKVYFLYGGNLGKPQGISKLAEAIKSCVLYKKAHFVIVGRGTERHLMRELSANYNNIDFFEELPVENYNALVQHCDVGIISLDNRFTVPNYPSRVLNYMNASKPVLCFTDKVTDFNDMVVSDAKCGLWAESGDNDGFFKMISFFSENENERKSMGENGRKYLEKNFNVKTHAVKIEN